MQKVANGIVHGRFQPPHNGHIRYILSALDKAEHLVIGICTPRICTPEEALATGYPCTAELNPFSYSDRKEMITAALSELGVPREKYSFVDFPSDYTGIGNIVSKDTVFLMSMSGESDMKKREYLETLGFTVDTVIAVPEDESIEKGSLVRAGLTAGTHSWEPLVPKSISEFLKNRQK